MLVYKLTVIIKSYLYTYIYDYTIIITKYNDTNELSSYPHTHLYSCTIYDSFPV